MSRVADITESGIAVTGSYYRSGQQLEFHSEIVDLDASEPLTTVESVRGAVEDPGRAIDSVRVSVVGALGTLLNPTVRNNFV